MTNTLMTDTVAIQDRIRELCHQFRLPTMGAESVSRFTATGHGAALETLLEVLEQEAEDRRQRRIGRLHTASRLPSGKTWETPASAGAGSSSTTGCPGLSDSNWANWPTAASSTGASTCWPSGCRAPGKPTPYAPSATGWWSRAGRCSSPRPTGWCRTCSPPSGTWPCPDNCASSTATTFCSSTTWATCPRGPRSRRCSSPSSPNATNGGPWASRPTPSRGWGQALVFSQWEHIFANPMTTAAAIDRVVHHSVILEFNVPSYRTGMAQQRGQDKEVNRQE